jgi:glycerol-3-phosphate acyltransferase PlsY
MIDLLIKVLMAYLLGSVSGSMVIGMLRQVDIRQSGSGNAGGTNAFRTQGFWFALGVVIIDIGKGVLAAWVLPGVELAALGSQVSVELQMLCCGFAAVVGHCYPVWYGFKGGKGAATAVGALAVIQPVVLLPMVIAWLGILTLTGWVGLATMVSALSMIPAFVWLGASNEKIGFAIVLAGFIVFMHRSNIANMLNGTENRFQRIRFVNWFR